MKRKLHKIMFEYLMITGGCALMAAGIFFFFAPNTIAPGGVSGFAVVIQKATGFPIDITNLIVNIPLFIAGVLVLGKTFGVKTAYATIIFSAFIRLYTIVFPSDLIVTQDILLAVIYGSVIMGVGLGFIFKYGGTTGGTALGGAILNKFFPSLSIVKLMTALDLFVVAAAGLVVRNTDNSLYSIIALYIIVKSTDFIVEGLGYAKAFHIISLKSELIAKKITDDIGRGVTLLEAKGFYTGEKRNVLLCVVNRVQVAKLKKIVNEIDKNAFMMVTTTHEVLGEGFNETD
ncbi:MAG: YitT family protein [Clostridiales bacterium]|nr:YitT family protein [Clostridiales bacterium]